MIDSNQTRYHLLLGKEDWARCTTISGAPIFTLDAQGAELFSWNERSELTLGRRANLFHSAPGNKPPVPDARRGTAQDRFGNWYWIDNSKTELLVNSSGTAVTSHFWSSTDEFVLCETNGEFSKVPPETPEAPLTFSGLTVTEQHYLVVGVLQPAGLLVFDLFHGGPPRQLVWPSAVPFVPFELASAPKGGVWVLDRQNRRLWALDRSLAVMRRDQSELSIADNTDVFSPADGTPPAVGKARTFPAGIDLNSGSPLGSVDPLAMEPLPDGSVIFLVSVANQDFSEIYRFRFGQQLGTPVSLDAVLKVIAPDDRPTFKLRALDFAFLNNEQTPFGARQNILYVVPESGDQAWAFEISFDTDQLSLNALAEYYPMRLFGGKALVAGQKQAFYDSQNRWVPLTMQKRPRYVESATLLTRVFDGKEPDCVWHRLFVDAAVTSDTSIQISSRNSNDRQAIENETWHLEPSGYSRPNGTELPWTATPACLSTWELLFQRAQGRFLQLRIVLSGNGQTTPRIRGLRAYYPRFSYLKHYLPAVYREDADSASFLDRFLANIEGFYTSIEDLVATVQAILDPESAPDEALDWLANWFGVALDPAWCEAKRRLFLRNAASFFEARGTVPGLMMALRLTLEDCVDSTIFSSPTREGGGPRVFEKFRSRYLPPALLKNIATGSGLPVRLQTVMWIPALGADELDRRYRESMKLPAGSTYPLSMATSESQHAAWRSFSMKNLGFVPERPNPGSDLWQLFLRNQYGAISALNAAYRTSHANFAEVPFPIELPRLAQPLADWYQFQGVLLLQSTAHQFIVFLPMPAADAQDVLAHRQKMNLARRVIELEKPAHTSFEIKFYWAFFRLGDARLGKDTVLDYGSRAPQLMSPFLLGDSFVGSGYISHDQSGAPRHREFLRWRSC